MLVDPVTPCDKAGSSSLSVAGIEEKTGRVTDEDVTVMVTVLEIVVVTVVMAVEVADGD